MPDLPTGVYWPVNVSAPVFRSMRNSRDGVGELVAHEKEVSVGIEIESARMVAAGPFLAGKYARFLSALMENQAMLSCRRLEA